MNEIRNWLQRFCMRFSAGMRGFMAGRYGTDRLNMTILGAGLAASFLSVLISNPKLDLLLVFLSYGLMIWAIFRSLSRNTYKRYLENRNFLQFFDRLKDRDHRYFNCPKCHQMVRVPRGKGKISITCPKCREKFVKKT